MPHIHEGGWIEQCECACIHTVTGVLSAWWDLYVHESMSHVTSHETPDSVKKPFAVSDLCVSVLSRLSLKEDWTVLVPKNCPSSNKHDTMLYHRKGTTID